MSARPFALQPDEYWTAPWKNLRELAASHVSRRTPALILDVPEQVPLGVRDTAPLLALYADTSESVLRVPYPGRALVATMNLDTGVLEVGVALPTDRRPEAPRASTSPGFMAMEHMSDLFTTGTVSDEPARYLVTLILRDKVSNRLPIDVTGSPTSYNDEAVEEYLRQARDRLPPRSAHPPEGECIVYGEGAGCPSIPTRPGIAITADRLVVLDGESPAEIRGSFRLPVFATDVLREANHPGVENRIGRPAPKGIVLITLLLVGAEGDWDVIPLAVPTFARLGGYDGERIAVGFFRIDVLALDSAQLPPQTYFVYAFSGEFMTGPVPMALISEEMLPAS